MVRKEGIGSYFNYVSDGSSFTDSISIPFTYEIFYTGRHALLFTLNEITGKKEIGEIWFPNYYCQHTLHWIKQFYANIKTYEIHPFEFDKHISISDFAAPEDVVLLNNYWGLSSMPDYSNNDKPIIIEDHSHGWLSDACCNSKADYCFVSLRKSLPIPLGGIAWKPSAHLSVEIDDSSYDQKCHDIWDEMLVAMKLKTNYINEESVVSDEYLSLFYEVENKLNQNKTFSWIREEDRAFINSLIRLNIKDLKNKNLKFLYEELKDNSYFKIVKRDGFVAFGFDLIFESEIVFNSLRSYLISHGIYPSVLWPDNQVDYEWQFFLNIHVDFRYNLGDMEYIINVIKNWLKDQPTGIK
ncbi:hypothetical protein ABN763_01695 [Spongiivirga sp. MCCC 1A20706]|uniref:hypothetical protein n=1 Tax=Spongiivirga sp. MCCC 1A20706 TaxID=3160963 RepID=UPI00397772A9